MEESSTSHALIGDVEYPLVRAKLRAWLVLEDKYADVVEAAEGKDREKLIFSLYSYISAAFSIPIEKLKACPWYEIARAFKDSSMINRPSIDFPMFHRIKKERQETKVGWDYPERTWYIWLHELASAFGWSIEYIQELDIDDAIALLEEVLVDHQLRKEWEWGMSEIAYPYEESTKKNRFVPLDRPDWMKMIARPTPMKKVRIKASELPVGLVLKWDTDDTEYTHAR